MQTEPPLTKKKCDPTPGKDFLLITTSFIFMELCVAVLFGGKEFSTQQMGTTIIFSMYLVEFYEISARHLNVKNGITDL